MHPSFSKEMKATWKSMTRYKLIVLIKMCDARCSNAKYHVPIYNQISLSYLHGFFSKIAKYMNFSYTT